MIMRFIISAAGMISMVLCIGAVILLFLGNEGLAFPLVIAGIVTMGLSWGTSILTGHHSRK